MTTRERIIKSLELKGMFRDQAEAVFELAQPKMDGLVPGYTITWDHPADEYPDAVFLALGLTLNRVALEWIDENIPQAWFRPMFDSEQLQEIMKESEGS